MLRAALVDAPSRRFFAAHRPVVLGSGLAHVVLPLLAYEHTGSAWAVTAVLVPDLLPAIVFGPLPGALVDRAVWRTCAMAADLLRFVAFTLVLFTQALPALGWPPHWRDRRGAVLAGRTGGSQPPGSG